MKIAEQETVAQHMGQSLEQCLTHRAQSTTIV